MQILPASRRALNNDAIDRDATKLEKECERNESLVAEIKRDRAEISRALSTNSRDAWVMRVKNFSLYLPCI
jgi:hypothetical protein